MEQMTMEQMTMEQMTMEQMFPKISSNSASGDAGSPGTLCNASRQSGTSSKTSTSSAGSRKSAYWNNSSSSAYDADDERGPPGSDSGSDASEQSDGSESPTLNEQGVLFFIRNENAEKEMMLYNIRKKKKDAAARMRHLERGHRLWNQSRLHNFTRSEKPKPYYHPSNYIDTNTFRSSLAEHRRPLTSPKLMAADAPSTPKRRSKTRLWSERGSP